jgi:phytoene/squalene synthetase
MDRAPPEPLVDLITRVEPDRYVAALFAPREKRSALMALYAFDHEVGRIASIVHEPMVGHIRLGWWREQVGAIYGGGVVLAPVVVALAEVVRVYGLPREIFDAYLDARGYDFDEAAFADAAVLERYAAAVSGGIMRLGAFVLGGGGEVTAEQAGIVFACARLSASRAPDALAMAGRALDRLGKLPRPARIMPVVSAAATARWMLRNDRRPIAPWQRVARIAVANLTRRI